MSRIHYIDAMRGVMMALGIVLHSANIFSVNNSWEVHAPMTHWMFDVISDSIHVFRMPVFFITAGFFAQMTLSRKSVNTFLKHRSRRLIFPFLTTALTLNVIQLELEAHYQYSLLSTHPNFVTDLTWYASGQWMEHLWFLDILFQMCLIAAGVLILVHKFPNVFSPVEWQTKQNSTILLVGALSYACVTALSGKLPFGLQNLHLLGLINIPVLMFYFPFFGFGMWLYRTESALESFGRFQCSTVAIGLALVVMQMLPDSSINSFDLGITVFCNGLTCWWTCHLCFCTFRLLANTPSACFRYFSDASYTIFLFHHVLIVVFAIIMIPISISIFAKFTIISGASFGLSLLIYEFGIRRNSLLGFLFNGNDFPALTHVIPDAMNSVHQSSTVEPKGPLKPEIIIQVNDHMPVESDDHRQLVSPSL